MQTVSTGSAKCCIGGGADRGPPEAVAAWTSSPSPPTGTPCVPLTQVTKTARCHISVVFCVLFTDCRLWRCICCPYFCVLFCCHCVNLVFTARVSGVFCIQPMLLPHQNPNWFSFSKSMLKGIDSFSVSRLQEVCFSQSTQIFSE